MINGHRRSGILLHLTSLPGPHGSGDLGEGAYHFVDWLESAGQTVWQVLPVGPPGMANSPYMALSSFAGSPMLVDLLELVRKGWLRSTDLESLPAFSGRRIEYHATVSFRERLLMKAAQNFLDGKGDQSIDDFRSFCEAHRAWLDDYAVFQVINDLQGKKPWTQWPDGLRTRDSSELASLAEAHRADIEVRKFIQWRFFAQWSALRTYARNKGIVMMGDLPIFVAHDSADVWAHQDMYYLDDHGEPTVVAGVPPDYFSVTGQRWGNPLYRWDRMKKTKYNWWKDRVRACTELFDLVRIDHFRGFEAYWEIPASEKTAVKGRWVKGPGAEFFKTLKRSLKDLPIVAEDLGLITPEVIAIRDEFSLPGMKVLQFAFASGPENGFLPHHHVENAVVYTGTHDNDTSRGWYETATEHERDFLRRYFQTDASEVHWTLIRGALQSVARIALIPFQDVFGLGSEHRMNTPGTTVKNWEWRFTWDMVHPDHAGRLLEMTALSHRCSPSGVRLVPYPEGRSKP